MVLVTSLEQQDQLNDSGSSQAKTSSPACNQRMIILAHDRFVKVKRKLTASFCPWEANSGNPATPVHFMLFRLRLNCPVSWSHFQPIHPFLPTLGGSLGYSMAPSLPFHAEFSSSRNWTLGRGWWVRPLHCQELALGTMQFLRPTV